MPLVDCLNQQEGTLNIQQTHQVQHKPEHEEEKVQKQTSYGYESGERLASIPLTAKPKSSKFKPRKKLTLNLKVDIKHDDPEMLRAALQPRHVEESVIQNNSPLRLNQEQVNVQLEEAKHEEAKGMNDFDAMLLAVEQTQNNGPPEVEHVIPNV